jgi:hypothetical protein
MKRKREKEEEEEAEQEKEGREEVEKGMVFFFIPTGNGK